MKEFTFQVDVSRTENLIKKGDWVILGYATTYDLKEDGIKITREALDDAKNDLLKYSTVLFNHNPDRPIGKIVETDVDEVGLMIKMVLSKEEEEIWKKVQDGTINKFSIQGRIIESEPLGEDSENIKVNKIKLYEAGLVSVPGDGEAKTISWWVARSLTKTVSKNNMKTYIKKLEKIRDKSNDEVKEELDTLIEELKVNDNVISKLEALSTKAKKEDKEALEYAINSLKRKEEKEEEIEIEDDAEYNLSDETEQRPVFQVNIDLTDEDEITDEKGKNVFRKQILRKGKWHHWGAPGGILSVTDNVIASIVSNFKSKILDHVSVPLSHTNDPSKNAGEVLELMQTENGLDAVIEIKDDTIAEKIRKGLIKGISASLDSNYYLSEKGKFVGPTMLHAALVAEPFIKGMENFISLSDEYQNRNIIQLEDKQPDFYTVLEMIRETLSELQKNVITEEKLKETIETLVNRTKEEVVEEKDEVKEELKAGDSCSIDDETEGQYVEDEEGKLVCKPIETKENKDDEEEVEEKKDEEKNDEYEKCVSDAVENGKDLGEAIKDCGKKYSLEKQPSEEESGDKLDDESEDVSQTTPEAVDLSDVEISYERYLKEGKIVPSQKEAFISMLTSVKVLNLSDKQVDVAELFDTFMKNQPKVVNFEEQGAAGGEPQKQEVKEEMPVEVKKFYEKMGLSDEATKESYEYAKKLQEDEKKEKESTIFN